MSWLSGWGKRIKLTIDHLKVDEDLVDFPLMIHLSNNSGRNDADVTDVFDELDYNVNDNFTGTNGDSPNSDRWNEIETTNGTIQIYNNELKFELTSSAYNEYPNAPAFFNFPGDFDIQIDFTSVNVAGDGNGIELFCKFSNGNDFFIKAGQAGATQSFLWRFQVGGTKYSGNTPRTNSYGKFRLIRSGNTCTIKYRDGSGDWQTVGSRTDLPSTAGHIRLGFWHGTDANAASGTLDNFVVNSGTVVWPQKTFPNRKKLLITDDSGNPLYTEIDRWDQDRKKAYLWAKVPTVYSGSDTILYLYYDSSQLDNDNYIGDTGDLVAQDVWDDNFTAVYHMSQDPTGGAGCILDSTSNVNSGTPNGSMTSDDLVDGLMGKGLDFDGTDDYVNCGNDSSLDITNKISLAACYYSYNRGDWEVPICKGQAYPNDLYGLYYESSTNTVSFVLNFTTAGRSSSQCIFNLKDGFHLIEGIYGGNNMKLYIDGDLKNTVNIGSDTIKTDTSSLLIGDRNNDTVYAKGIVDESRISNIARSPAWVKSTYYSNFDNLIIFGSKELEPKYYYHGFVKEHNMAVGRTVRLYNRNTGELMDEDTSRSSDGYYYLTTSVSGLHFIVAFDDDAGEDFNALILDKLLPRGME